MEKAILDKRVTPGMVYTGGSGGSKSYVVIRVDESEVLSLDLEDSCKYTNKHSSGYGWWTTGSFEFIRQMGKMEFKKISKAIIY